MRWLEQDVTHLLPGGPHADVQARVAGRLRAAWGPDWAGVTENYGGTAGHHAAFLRSKLAFAQAVHAGADAAEVARLERVPGRGGGVLAGVGGLPPDGAGRRLTCSRLHVPH